MDCSETLEIINNLMLQIKNKTEIVTTINNNMNSMNWNKS
jgi:hypothetical protein